MKLSAPHSFYTGVFAVSGILMALQVIQARIFSVTTWYHLSFLVISVAMFGLTMGALHVHKGDPERQRARHRELMAEAARKLGLYTVVALGAQMALPIVASTVIGTAVTLPLMSYFVIPPYYFAGIVLSLALTRTPYPAARTYGIDLLGAGAGCLLALGLMETIDAPSAVLVLSLAALAAARCFAKTGNAARTGVMALCIGAALALNLAAARPFIYPVWIKDRAVAEASYTYDHWNSISRVIVGREEKNVAPFLWGASSRLPPDIKSSFYGLQIDGNAGTALTKFNGDPKSLGFLDYDVTTIAYALPGLAKAGIIGVGGGRDVLSAWHRGIADITAMDVNSSQISLLTRREPFRSYTNLASIPGLRLIHAEARSWFSSVNDKFDIIQMSLIDTLASTGAGAFALSENGLYTVEAWKTFLDHLNPGGVMTVSRWYLQDAHSETERLVSLAAAAALTRGDGMPGRHIFIATAGHIATLVLSHDPFTPAQVAALEARARKMDFAVLLSPARPAAAPELAAMLASPTREDLEKITANSVYDASPPTDERPFFFNQVRLTRPMQVFRLVAENSSSSIIGLAHAILNLYLIIGFSFLMVTGVILLPLRGAMKDSGGRGVARGTLWFLLIGFGFMLLEISMLQRWSIYLGHPAYGLGIVLFSLVLSTGVGSLLCGRFPLETGRARLLWIAVTAAAAVAEIFATDATVRVFADVSLPARAGLCVALLMPMGCLLGFGFPTGMALANKAEPRHTAWFWGINGSAGVMGSAIAVALDISAGLDVTMALGALCYALLVFPAWRGRG